MISNASFVLLAALAFGSYLSSGSASAQGLSEGAPLSRERKVFLEKKALRGSRPAAREIALWHGTRDDRLFEYWSWVGAENGDPQCQYNYAMMLRAKGDPYSRLRAIYWMRKAAAEGESLAAEALGRWESAND